MQINFNTLLMAFKKRSVAHERPPPIDPNWWRDPLSHPDLKVMSQRQLADLQFAPDLIKAK